MITSTFSNIDRDKYLKLASISIVKKKQIIVTYNDITGGKNDSDNDCKSNGNNNNNSDSNNHDGSNYNDDVNKNYSIDKYTKWARYAGEIER